jgi:hypothetical protein
MFGCKCELWRLLGLRRSCARLVFFFFSHVQVWHGEVTRRRPCCITLMLRVGACMVLCYASRGACVRREMQGFVRRCEIVHGVRVREGWTVVH